MYTTTWTLMNRDGHASTRTIHYDSDLAALAAYSEAINASTPLPVTAAPGMYLHVKVQLADCLVVAQWHHINTAGELVLTPENDVIEQLADHLVEQITAELL